MRQVIEYTDDEGYWIAEYSSLPSCVSQGDTKVEALANIEAAIDFHAVGLKPRSNLKSVMPRYTLEELDAGITDENRDEEFWIGSSVGKEII